MNEENLTEDYDEEEEAARTQSALDVEIFGDGEETEGATATQAAVSATATQAAVSATATQAAVSATATEAESSSTSRIRPPRRSAIFTTTRYDERDGDDDDDDTIDLPALTSMPT